MNEWRRFSEWSDRLVASAVDNLAALERNHFKPISFQLTKEATPMNDENQIEQAIQAKGKTAPRVLPAEIDAAMQRITYVTEQQPGGTTSTFVHAFLDGKFHLATGTSACVNPANFDAEIGHDIALKNATMAARQKLWELEGYRLYAHLQHELDTAEVQS